MQSCNHLVLLGQAQGVEYFVKGALEKILQHCTHFMSAAGVLVPIQEAHRRDYVLHSAQLGTMGLRGQLQVCACVCV